MFSASLKTIIFTFLKIQAIIICLLDFLFIWFCDPNACCELSIRPNLEDTVGYKLSYLYGTSTASHISSNSRTYYIFGLYIPVAT